MESALFRLVESSVKVAFTDLVFAPSMFRVSPVFAAASVSTGALVDVERAV